MKYLFSGDGIGLKQAGIKKQRQNKNIIYMILKTCYFFITVFHTKRQSHVYVLKS